MKVITTILIVAGLLISSYPLADRIYTRRLESQLLDKWEMPLNQDVISADTSDDFEQLQLVFEEEMEEDRETVHSVRSNTPELTNTDAEVEQDSTDSSEASSKKSSSKIQAIGRIEIPKIEVNIPIVEGTSKASLKLGAGHMNGTSEIGSIGNAALAAHRGHTYGRLFNRLDEMEVGDTIRVTTDEGSFEYTVYKILVVTPDDLSVLYRSKEDRVLTLITCTPLYTATHRLIVHAVMR